MPLRTRLICEVAFFIGSCIQNHATNASWPRMANIALHNISAIYNDLENLENAMRNHKLQHPITPDSLLAHAIELEEALKADPKASALCPSDGVWRERYEAQLEIKLCMACAAWMQQHRMDKVCAIGPFMSIDEPKKGDKIRVRKGATVRSYHPQRPVSITTREQEVTVDHVINGFVDFNKGDDHPVVHQPEIRWAGAGGYWRWIDPNDMVRPEAPTRPA